MNFSGLIYEYFNVSGGGTATYATHWLDTVKTKMQSFPHKYKSGYECMKSTIRYEGFRGLFNGASPAVFGQMCKSATVFMSYSLCIDLVKALTGIISGYHPSFTPELTLELCQLF